MRSTTPSTIPISSLLLITSLLISPLAVALAQPHSHPSTNGHAHAHAQPGGPMIGHANGEPPRGHHPGRVGHAHIAHAQKEKEIASSSSISADGPVGLDVGAILESVIHNDAIPLPLALGHIYPHGHDSNYNHINKLDRRAGAPASTDTAGQAIYSSEQNALTDSTTAVAATTTAAVAATTSSGVAVVTASTTSQAVGVTSTSVVAATSAAATSTAVVDSDTIVTSSSTVAAVTSTSSAVAVVTSSSSAALTTTSTSATQLTVTIQTTVSSSSSATTNTLTSTIGIVKTTSASRTTAATASSTKSASSANDSSSTSSSGLSKTTIIALIVVGCVLVAVAAGWTLFRKWKLKPRSRFDARLNPLDFSPSNDLPDPFMEKTRRTGMAAYGANRMSGTSMTSISSADRQRRQFVNELDMEQDDGGGMGEKHGYDQYQQPQQMRYGAMGYPPLMNDLPGHDFTAPSVAPGVGYPPAADPNDGYANLRRAPSTAGTNFAGYGAGTRGLETSANAPGGYYSDHGHGDNGMEMMGGHHDESGGNAQYLDESFNAPDMGYGRPTAGAGPYAAATHFAGSGARY